MWVLLFMCWLFVFVWHRAPNPDTVLIIQTPLGVISTKNLLQDKKRTGSRLIASNRLKLEDCSTAEFNEIELVSAARCRIFKRMKNKVPLEVTYLYRRRNSFEYGLGCFVGDSEFKVCSRMPTNNGDLNRILPPFFPSWFVSFCGLCSIGQLVYLFSNFAEVSRHFFFHKERIVCVQKASDLNRCLDWFCSVKLPTCSHILQLSELYAWMYVNLVFYLGPAMNFDHLCWLLIGCIGFSLGSF